jgi:hypothetical protein
MKTVAAASILGLAAVPVALMVLAAPAHADQQTFLADVAAEGGFGCEC